MGDLFEMFIAVIVPTMAVVIPILLLAFLCVIPIEQIETRAFVKEFEQTMETVKVVRANNEMPEADVMIIANQNLAKYKYYNSIPILGWAITDKVDDLKPIE